MQRGFILDRRKHALCLSRVMKNPPRLPKKTGIDLLETFRDG